MIRRHWYLAISVLTLLALPALAPGAHAQSPAPSADDTWVFVSRFVVTGATVFSQAQLQAQLAEGEGREMTLAQMKDFAALITAFYRGHGYILARAYVPPQEMRGGVVEIAVVEGRVAKIDITGLRHYSGETLRRYVEPRSPTRVFEASDFERGLLLRNDLPGLVVKSTLRPGAGTGTTDIVLDVEKDRLITDALDANNYGSPGNGLRALRRRAESQQPLRPGRRPGLSRAHVHCGRGTLARAAVLRDPHQHAWHQDRRRLYPLAGRRRRRVDHR